MVGVHWHGAPWGHPVLPLLLPFCEPTHISHQNTVRFLPREYQVIGISTPGLLVPGSSSQIGRQ